jgi:hypothetical protein
MAGIESDVGEHSKYRLHDLKVAIEKGEIDAALAIAEEINQWLKGALLQLRKLRV